MPHESCEWCGAPDGSVSHVARFFDGPPGPHLWSGTVPWEHDTKDVHVAIWAACTVCRSEWQTWPRLLS